MPEQQKVPCSSDLQLVDNSPKLDEKDAPAFGSVIGLCLYVGSERPDSTIKELASVMSCPTVSSLQHLRKLIGFMKSVGDVGVKLQTPQPGIGKMHSGGSHAWVLEPFSEEKYFMWCSYAEWMFHVWFKPRPESDFVVKLRVRASQFGELCL